jgi:hypothetical protein
MLFSYIIYSPARERTLFRARKRKEKTPKTAAKKRNGATMYALNAKNEPFSRLVLLCN